MAIWPYCNNNTRVYSRTYSSIILHGNVQQIPIACYSSVLVHKCITPSFAIPGKYSSRYTCTGSMLLQYCRYPSTHVYVHVYRYRHGHIANLYTAGRVWLLLQYCSCSYTCPCTSRLSPRTCTSTCVLILQ